VSSCKKRSYSPPKSSRILRLPNRGSHQNRCTPDSRAPRNPQSQMQPKRKLQRAFQPSQRFNLALSLPFGPSLALEPSRAEPERLELRPNSYCRLLLGRPPFGLVFACISLHSSLQNHFVLPTGALSRFTQARWNHSRGQSSLSQATILP
jgi:hypothetical protein